MNNQKSEFKPLFVSQEEEDIINDIRALEFGRILINIQNNVMVNKEITKMVKNFHKKNNLSVSNISNVSGSDN